MYQRLSALLFSSLELLAGYPVSASLIQCVIAYALQTKNHSWLALSLTLWKQYYLYSDETIRIFSHIPDYSVLLKEICEEEDVYKRLLSIRIHFIASIEHSLLASRSHPESALFLNDDFCLFIQHLLSKPSIPLSLLILIINLSYVRKGLVHFVCNSRAFIDTDEIERNRMNSLEVDDLEEEYVIQFPSIFETILNNYDKLSQTMQKMVMIALNQCTNYMCITHLSKFLLTRIYALLPSNPLIRQMFLLTHIQDEHFPYLNEALRYELLLLLKQYYPDRDALDITTMVPELIEQEMKSTDISLLPFYTKLIGRLLAGAARNGKLDTLYCIAAECIQINTSSNYNGFIVYLGVLEMLPLMKEEKEQILSSLFQLASLYSLLPFVLVHSFSLQLYSTCYHYASFTDEKYRLFQQVTDVLNQFECNPSDEMPEDLFGSEAGTETNHLFIPHKDLPFICQECNSPHLPTSIVYADSLSGKAFSFMGDPFLLVCLYRILQDVGSQLFKDMEWMQKAWSGGEKGNYLERSLMYLCDMMTYCSLEDPLLLVLLEGLCQVMTVLLTRMKEVETNEAHRTFLIALIYLSIDSINQLLLRSQVIIKEVVDGLPEDHIVFTITEYAVDILYQIIKGVPKVAELADLPSFSTVTLLFSKQNKQAKQRKNGTLDLSNHWIVSEYDKESFIE